MKKLLNKKDDIVDELLAGFALCHNREVSLVPGTHIIKRKDPKEKGKVKLIVGNGAGHEPVFIGLVGKGGFDMNVVGEIFTAPSYEKIFEGIQNIDDGSPIFLTVMNHAGDVLNANLCFEMAKEVNINIYKDVFYDDVGSAPKDIMEERRGMTGLLFFGKIVGAMAEEGRSIEGCMSMFASIRDNTRTIGLVMEACTHPVSGVKMFELAQDEVEIGMGVHGEGGAYREKMDTSRAIVRKMCDMLLNDKPYAAGDEVLVIINGSGSTTMMELNIAYKETYEYLKEKGIVAKEGMIGNYVTTQEAAGFTISFLKLEGEMEKYWNAPSGMPCFKKV